MLNPLTNFVQSKMVVTNNFYENIDIVPGTSIQVNRQEVLLTTPAALVADLPPTFPDSNSYFVYLTSIQGLQVNQQVRVFNLRLIHELDILSPLELVFVVFQGNLQSGLPSCQMEKIKTIQLDNNPLSQLDWMIRGGFNMAIFRPVQDTASSNHIGGNSNIIYGFSFDYYQI
jgi:hypothetical protein